MKKEAYLGEERLVIRINNEKKIFSLLGTDFPQYIYDYKKSNHFSDKSDKRLKFIQNELPYYEDNDGLRVIEDEPLFDEEDEDEDFFDDEYEDDDPDEYLLDEDNYK